MERYDPPVHLQTGAVVVIVPGGGFIWHSDSEAKGWGPTAWWLNQLGITAYLLTYRICPEGHPWPAQLQDLIHRGPSMEPGSYSPKHPKQVRQQIKQIKVFVLGGQ